jgi:predicted GNAT superfamily acetyltransferase
VSDHAEAAFGGLTIRTCHTVGEFRQVLALQKDVWGFVDAELVPLRLFVVGERIGGHVVGAFNGQQLVAFAFGLPGMREGHPYIHSHMLAVREELRNTGLGRAMKLFQRELVMRQGFALMEWTFDPLEIKNAYFNVERLGTIARSYVVNQYGITGSPLQGGLPSDRLVAEWWLKSERVLSTLEHGHRPPVKICARIEVPAEIYTWKAAAETRTRAAEVQVRIREEMQRQLTNQLAVVGYERDAAGNGCFLLGEQNVAEW